MLATNLFAQNLYKWTDENGVVHYSDYVPPEHSRQDRDLLNERGIAVGAEQGEITEEERVAIELERLAEEQARIDAQDAARRDQILLDTYLSIEDIERTRDRWLELIGSQVRVTERYLASLHTKLEDLHGRVSRFAPYSDQDDARPVPNDLRREIESTESSIELFEQRLGDSQAEHEQVQRRFEADIERFRELKEL